MTTIFGPNTVGFWFCDTVQGDQNFFGMLSKADCGTKYIFQYRFYYLKEKTKNWYTWEMNTNSPEAVIERIDYLFKLLPMLGLTPSGPLQSVIRKPGQSENEFAKEAFSQPWLKVAGIIPPAPDRVQ